jgi:hypothetical protein
MASRLFNSGQCPHPINREDGKIHHPSRWTENNIPNSSNTNCIEFYTSRTRGIAAFTTD